MKKEINIISCWVNLSRAYEIAKLGGLKIKIVFEKDYKNGFDDYQLIKAFYGPEIFSSTGEMVVEITPPQLSDMYPKRATETRKDLRIRIEQGRMKLKSYKFASESCETLLRTAVNRLNLSLSDIEIVKEIAAVIAQLDKGGDIHTDHLAEAIQYRSYFYRGETESYCIAENKSLQFGTGINISLCDLDNIDIQNAIDYLSDLIGVEETVIS